MWSAVESGAWGKRSGLTRWVPLPLPPRGGSKNCARSQGCGGSSHKKTGSVFSVMVRGVK